MPSCKECRHFEPIPYGHIEIILESDSREELQRVTMELPDWAKSKMAHIFTMDLPFNLEGIARENRHARIRVLLHPGRGK